MHATVVGHTYQDSAWGTDAFTPIGVAIDSLEIVIGETRRRYASEAAGDPKTWIRVEVKPWVMAQWEHRYAQDKP